MAIEVLKPGLLTTVQDAGRTGSRQYGVTAGGAMDALASRAANLLVGNDEAAAVLELTLAGPALKLQADAVIAVCGADLPVRANGEAVPLWRAVLVRRGSVLRLGACRAGCRAYVAVGGGLAVRPVLGSRSTDMRAGIGGWEGKPLEAGAVLPFGEPSADASALLEQLLLAADQAVAAQAPAQTAPADASESAAVQAPPSPVLGGAVVPSKRFVQPSSMAPYVHGPYVNADETIAVRLVRGPEFAAFDADSRSKLFSGTFKLLPQSNRMGCRLAGPALRMEEAERRELLSTAVTPGTVQVPPDGQPIVLMADSQTTGGYPRIGWVAAVDLPLLAQARPGGELRFRDISADEAEALWFVRESELRQLRFAILHGYGGIR